MQNELSIKSMPLYIDVERIYNELAELGIGQDATLAPEHLFPFDQYHYHGTDAVENAARTLELGPTSRIIELGSGIGGPARYLAQTRGCHVTALELQSELHTVASLLTARCGLADRVAHVNGDALSYPMPDKSFDALVSWLAIHHIPERQRLMERCARTLRDDGCVYIEDLYRRKPFAPTDTDDVRRVIFGVSLTSIEEYTDDLRKAGFSTVAVSDMTDSWSAFCAGRLESWQNNRERHIRVHGAEIYVRLENFFSVVRGLFAKGSLGGIRIVARK